MLLLLSHCAGAPRTPGPLAADASFDIAIDHAADDLLVQLQRLPEFQNLLQRARLAVTPVRIAVDLAVDSSTGQATAATQVLDSRLLGRAAAKFPQFEVQRVSAEALAGARYLLVSTLTALPSSDPGEVRYRINLSLTDQRTSLVVAQASALSSALGVDATPTPFFRDSPALSRDRAVDGQIRTSQTRVGGEADGVYLASLPVGTLISEAADLYDAGEYERALAMYEVAATRPDGKQARVFNGLYLSNTRLERREAATRAFGQIVSLGLSTNNLAVKFLFRPASTEFVADPQVSGPYPQWLEILAREIWAGDHCVMIVGHSSKTGAADVNDRLSLARASLIQQRLEALVPEIRGRLKSTGMGFRENLIGTGTDDLRDALDRRVEFKVRGCSG